MINRIELRDDLVIAFTENELKSLCRKLDIPYDLLHGKTQQDRFGVLIGRLERQNRLPELVLALVTANPNHTAKYKAYLEEKLPGRLEESSASFLLDASKGSGPAIEEPPTMTWNTQVVNPDDKES